MHLNVCDLSSKFAAFGEAQKQLIAWHFLTDIIENFEQCDW